MAKQKPMQHPLHIEWDKARRKRKLMGYGALTSMCPYPSLRALFNSSNPQAGMDRPDLIAELIKAIQDNSFVLPLEPYATAFSQRGPWSPKQATDSNEQAQSDRPASPDPKRKFKSGKKRPFANQIPPESRASVAKAFEAMKLPDYGELSQSPVWKKLSPKNSTFVYNYFATGFDMMKAFTIAWPEARPTPTHTLEQQAQLMLGKSEIIKGLKVMVDYFLAERRIVLAPKILDVLEAQAFYDIGDILDDEGELVKPLHEMTREQRLCIKGIETKFYGKDADVSQKVITLVDRQQSIDKLARFIALFTVDAPGTPPPPSNPGGTHLHVHMPQDRVGHLKGIFQAASNLRLPTLDRGLEINPIPQDDEDDSPIPEQHEEQPNDSGSVELDPDDVPPPPPPTEEDE